ncbi:MAG: type 4a pilus biogenesis protein PilO [Desulfotomaculum sp.]|nr:type 4a pilus biogenesis protein PilO [Desulfotomaculum sp.]
MNLLSAVKKGSNSLSRREKVLAALLLFTVIIILYYKFIFEPQWTKIHQLQQKLNNSQRQLEYRLAEEWDDIPKLQERAVEIKKEIDKINELVPNTVNEPQLLVDLYYMAKKNNLHSETIKFSPLKKVQGKDYSIFSVSMDVTGKNKDIYNYLKEVEEYPRLNSISQVKFEPQDYDSSACSLVIDFYVLHEVEPDPKEYSFVDGLYGKQKPYQIFNLYLEEDYPPVEHNEQMLWLPIPGEDENLKGGN